MPVTSIITIGAVYLACYLIGAINFSLIAAALFLKRNLRDAGSGNPGFTNLLRLGNKKVAISALLLDIARGWLVMRGCAILPMETFWPFMALSLILGNLFPVFHGFRGGKGIAMSIGIIFAICPWGGLAGAVTLVAMILIWKRVSAGSLCFLLSAAITAFLLAPSSVWQVCFVLCAVGIWTHRQNLQRLASGTEPRIFSPK
ncbi:MAG: glycerol-3-phosphate acyltransferase [Deltaproteobacteria bacterium]|nr:glycerol-3-phosphate acyltransferase [Deltaproteobacteria bacterium]